MGEFLPENATTAPTSTVTPQAGVASDADLALMQKVLSAAVARPDLIPEGFMAYMQDFIQTSRLTIPIGQITGYEGAVGSIINQSLAGTQVGGGGSASLQHTFTDGEAYASTAGPSIVIPTTGSYLLIASFQSQASAEESSENLFQVVNNGVYVQNHSAPQTLGAVSVCGINAATCVEGTSVTSTIFLAYPSSTGSKTVTVTNAQLIALRYA